MLVAHNNTGIELVNVIYIYVSRGLGPRGRRGTRTGVTCGRHVGARVSGYRTHDARDEGRGWVLFVRASHRRAGED